MKLEGEDAITILTIKNTELPAMYIGDKLSRLDILAETANKTLVNIEVQIANESNIIKRTLYYWTQMYVLDSGDNYNKLCPAIMINILKFNLFPDREQLHSNYGLYEKAQMAAIAVNELIAKISTAKNMIKTHLANFL